jgi:hypothetical protein
MRKVDVARVRKSRCSESFVHDFRNLVSVLRDDGYEIKEIGDFVILYKVENEEKISSIMADDHKKKLSKRK